MIDVPVVLIVQIPRVQVVPETVEIPQLQLVGKIAEITEVLIVQGVPVSADLRALEEEEFDRKTDHLALVKLKIEKITVLTKTIEEKTVRLETLAVEVEKMKSELFEAETALLANPFAKVKGLITRLINRLQAEAPSEVSCVSYRDEGTSKATEKKEDLEADIAKRFSELEASVSTSSVSDTEVAKLQAELDTLGRDDELKISTMAQEPISERIVKHDAPQNLDETTTVMKLVPQEQLRKRQSVSSSSTRTATATPKTSDTREKWRKREGKKG